MGESGPLADPGDQLHDVFLLPLAVSRPSSFDGLDAGVLARRIPDFLHQLLNQGEDGPSALLEIQSPPEEGPARWILLPEPPDADTAFELLPDEETARAIVTGLLDHDGDGLWLELRVQFQDGAQQVLRSLIPRQDPARPLLRLAGKLAAVLGLPQPELPLRHLTQDGEAFLRYLDGLDGAALLSGELEVQPPVARVELLAPLLTALQLDAGFGLALRTLATAVAQAHEHDRLAVAECKALLARALRTRPRDGDACVAIAGQLTTLDDMTAARAWLEHAVELDPPPGRGLEVLGIQYANDGDSVQARHLWLRGVELDGHPDFFAHLARLAFGEDHIVEAWDKTLRGLRRIHERVLRAAEWEPDGRGAGVMLRYLVDHLADHKPAPPDVVEALLELCGLLEEHEDRIDLGLCLARVGREGEAVEELQAGLAGEDLDPEQRDAALHALLGISVDRFEPRFRRAVSRAVSHRDPAGAIPELDQFLRLQPDYWPARFFRAIAVRRSGDEQAAEADLRAVLVDRPAQPDVLRELAAIHERRGEHDQALGLIDRAVAARDEEAHLHVRRATLLLQLGRHDAAREAVHRALALDPKDADAKRLLRRLQVPAR